jgi:hypothetical protein
VKLLFGDNRAVVLLLRRHKPVRPWVIIIRNVWLAAEVRAGMAVLEARERIATGRGEDRQQRQGDRGPERDSPLARRADFVVTKGCTSGDADERFSPPLTQLLLGNPPHMGPSSHIRVCRRDLIGL